MTEEKKTYLQYAFRYGTIIGFISFLYYLIGYYTGFDKKVFIFDNLYFIIFITMFIVMMSKYRFVQTTKIKFSRYVSIGFIASVVIAFFVSAYSLIRVMVLDPYIIYQVISLGESVLPNYKLPEMTPAMLNIFKVSYVFANFLVNIFNNMVYVLIISAFMVWNNKIYDGRKKNN